MFLSSDGHSVVKKNHNRCYQAHLLGSKCTRSAFVAKSSLWTQLGSLSAAPDMLAVAGRKVRGRRIGKGRGGEPVETIDQLCPPTFEPLLRHCM